MYFFTPKKEVSAIWLQISKYSCPYLLMLVDSLVMSVTSLAKLTMLGDGMLYFLVQCNDVGKNIVMNDRILDKIYCGGALYLLSNNNVY